jgi:predicted NBD/HSP70 family sugar kinase
VVVTIDFTPEEVRLALAPLGGAPLLREAYPLPANVHDEAAWSWEIGGRISALFAHEGQRRSALGIAVACPGEVDEATGRLTRCPGRPEWDGLAVVDAVRRHIDAPVVALNRAHAALRGESEHGAAAEATDAIYLSLRGTPTAAVKTASRIVSGARGSAGALADFPALEPGAAVPEEAIEEMAGLLSDLAAFLDPGVIVLDAEDAHLAAIGPALQRAVNAVATGPVVVASALGESAALLGALGAAAIVAYEGERSA